VYLPEPQIFFITIIF